MPKDLKQLVLRTRKETLRSNLCQAYQTLGNLPSLSLRLEKIKKELDQYEQSIRVHADIVRSLRLGAAPALKNASIFMDDLTVTLGDWKRELGEIESSSFLAQVKSSGVEDWRSDLQLRAEDLRKFIEQNVSTWRDLTAVETEAREKVFGRSLELLGGIALRDARLNADVCELADELLKAIRPMEPKHYAILGGLSIILIRLERIVRLPFPQWSVWDLPFAAHEFWHVNRKSSDEVRERVIKALGPGILADNDVDHCLADAFATYSVGPAFGYAAITLWFVPSVPRYDHRVRAIQAMLRAMNKGWDGAGASYFDVANDLQVAWQSAVDQARPAPAEREPDKDDGGFDALYAAFTAEARGHKPLDDFAVSAEFRDALRAACQRVVAEAKPVVAPQVEDTQFDELCAVMIEGLQSLGYKRFPLSEWMAAKTWQDVLNKDNKSHDLRHVLNAAWLARIESTSDNDGTLTAALTERAKKFLKPQPARLDPRLPEGTSR